MSQYTFRCAILGNKTVFSVTLDRTQLVDELKQEIKKVAQLEPAACTLTLYKVGIDVSKQKILEKVIVDISQSSIRVGKEELNHPFFPLSEFFNPLDLPAETIHILVELPAGESINPKACGVISHIGGDVTYFSNAAPKSNPSGFTLFTGKNALTRLCKTFWGQPEKIKDLENGQDIEFNCTTLNNTDQRLYFFNQYGYLRDRIDSFRKRDTDPEKRCVIVTGTPGIGKAFYLLSPSDITSR